MVLNELAVGAMFRALRSDKRSDGSVVKNDKVYVKVGASTAVDVNNFKDECVFDVQMPVRLIRETPVGFKLIDVPLYNSINGTSASTV